MGAAQARAAVIQWLAAVLPGKTVVRGGQDAPRPALPYVTVRAIASAPVGQAQVEPGLHAPPGATVGTRDVTHIRRCTLSCQFFGDEACAMAEAAQAGLDTDAVLILFRKAGVGIEGTGGLTAIDAEVDGRQEQRWQFDVFCNVATQTEEELYWIETVEIEGTVVDVDGSVAWQETFEAP